MTAVITLLVLPFAIGALLVWWRPGDSAPMKWWEVAIAGTVVGFGFFGLLFWIVGLWLLLEGRWS